MRNRELILKTIMSDITKCIGTGCPWKTKCHRFTAPADPEYQAEFYQIPGKWVEELFNCEMFWGDAQKRIYDQLKSIMRGDENQ